MKTNVKLFYLAVLAFLLNAATILLMPFRIETESIFRYTYGILFWLFFAIGLVLTMVDAVRIKAQLVRQQRGAEWHRKRIGIISFMQNFPALIADVMTVLLLIATIILNRTEVRYSYLMYVLISAFLFALYMHCMFNGRVYKYMKNQEKRRALHEKT